MVREDFVDASISYLYLENVSIISQNNVFRNLKRQHCLKLVPLGLELRDLPLQEINPGIRHLLQVVRVDVL